MVISFSTYVGVVVAIALIQIITGSQPLDNNDIRNWIALVVEVGIGIALTLSIWFAAKYDQQKLSQLLQDVKNIAIKQEQILEVQEKFRKSRESFAIHTLRSYLPLIREKVQTVDKLIDRLNKEPASEQPLMKEIEDNQKEKINYINNLEDILNQSSGAIQSQFLVEGLRICKIARENGYERVGNGPWTHRMNVPAVLSAIDELLKIVPNPPL